MDRTPAPSVSFEQFAAERLNRDREQIARDWVEKLSAQLGVRPHRVLPSEELLDHIPQVLGKAAEFLVVPDTEKLTAQKLVTDEMRSIARLRRRQGYDVQEIIREFDELDSRNAAKYTDPAQPVRWVRVSFSRPPGSGQWWVEVADNGLGTSPEMHGRIFERFFRAHPEVAEGSGLGLSIVREAILQMESTLEFESEPGRGTTFRFALPGSE